MQRAAPQPASERGVDLADAERDPRAARVRLAPLDAGDRLPQGRKRLRRLAMGAASLLSVDLKFLFCSFTKRRKGESSRRRQGTPLGIKPAPENRSGLSLLGFSEIYAATVTSSA
ncbi:hypothetical protein [Chenggangzhangella methanolivorans]|uniref:Uncharacterized protein n=1 Tax=Chenggangzhangella methanolivorans TaxID=1437009 RepID=A0A9E6UGJ2_9HYPH|nr:hypothetical protein [Chenggangzhangella methanolivorans]QZN98787.1 hypothetical protein K6K41_17740 [Chenggangzhangella methanolivorans]